MLVVVLDPGTDSRTRAAALVAKRSSERNSNSRVECQDSMTALSSINSARSRCCAANAAADPPVPPVVGREFVFVALRQTCAEDRVFFLDAGGRQHSLPMGWTDAAGLPDQPAPRPP